MADWTLPTTANNWADRTSHFKNRDLDVAKGLDPAKVTVTNPQTDMIRWSSAINKWQIYNGTTWVDLTATYAISISGAAGSVPFSGVTSKPTTLSGYGITDAQPLDADLTALAALAATAGMLSRTGAGAFAVRTLTAPAAGITISNPTGSGGNPTWALANDLAALEALAANGFGVRTGTDAWTVRTITGTPNRITVTNGDGTAGNPTIDVGADVVVKTTPRVETVWIPAGSLTSRSTNGAASATTETATNKVMVKTMDFDQTTEQYAQFQIGMPKGWNEGTVQAVFYWTGTSGSGNVAWGLQGVAHSDDDALDAAFGTAQVVTDTFIAANDVHISPITSPITIGGTPAENDLVTYQVYRDADDAGDTFNATAKLLGVKLLITYNAYSDE